MTIKYILEKLNKEIPIPRSRARFCRISRDGVVYYRIYLGVAPLGSQCCFIFTRTTFVRAGSLDEFVAKEGGRDSDWYFYGGSHFNNDVP